MQAKHEKMHELEQIEAYLSLKWQTENSDKFIDIIENKKEFEKIYKISWEILANPEGYKQDIERIKKDWPKSLKDHLLLIYDKNPSKFEDMYTILDWINRNWLQNFFSKWNVKFSKQVKEITLKKLEQQYANVSHIPDSEKKFLNAIKKIYG